MNVYGWLRVLVILGTQCLWWSTGSSVSSDDGQRCGERKLLLRNRIVFGDQSDDGAWPWHGALFYLADYQCGCTLINEWLVLTAGHCVFNAETQNPVNVKIMLVKLGLHQLHVTDDGRTQIYQVREIIEHPKFEANSHKHDVALLRLGKGVVYGDYVQPICLDLAENIWIEYLAGVQGSVAGWGLTEHDRISEQLLTAKMPIARYTDCVESNPELYGRLIYSGMYCAGTRNGTSVCNGDSGGGMYIERDTRWYLRGVVSFSGIREGSNYCDAFSYVVFMNVPYYVRWISDEVRSIRNELAAAATTTELPTIGTRWEANGTDDVVQIALKFPEEDYDNEIDDASSGVKLRINVEEVNLAVEHVVEYGSSVTLSCGTGQTALPVDVSNQWYKLDKGQKVFLQVNNSLTLHNVSRKDSGMYVCIQESQEYPSTVSVSGFLPRFEQNGTTSYALIRTDASSDHFTLEISLQADTLDGIVFVKAKKDFDDNLIALLLNNGSLDLHYQSGGNGTMQVARNAKVRIERGQWHTVLISSYANQGLLALDGQVIAEFSDHLPMAAKSSLYLANSSVPLLKGFVGCISRLLVNDVHIDLRDGFEERVGISACTTCHQKPCLNDGICVESESERGFECICPNGSISDSCAADEQHASLFSVVADCPSCNSSKNGQEANGNSSEETLSFGKHSYALYRSYMFVDFFLELRFMPRMVEKSSFLIYAIEHQRGLGRYLALLLNDSRIELRSHSAIVLRSAVELQTERWYRLHAGYRDGFLYLRVENEREINRSVPGRLFSLNQQQMIYVGGLPGESLVNRIAPHVRQGFDGCIAELKLSNIRVELVDDAVEHQNVTIC